MVYFICPGQKHECWIVELNKVNPRLNWITLLFLDIEGLQIIIACFCLFCINSGHVLQHIKTGDFDFLLVGVGFKVGGNKNWPQFSVSHIFGDTSFAEVKIVPNFNNQRQCRFLWHHDGSMITRKYKVLSCSVQWLEILNLKNSSSFLIQKCWLKG